MIQNIEEILTHWLQKENPEETLEGVDIKFISHTKESYTYQINYNNGILDMVSVTPDGEVTHHNPFMQDGEEYRIGWYFFPCINFPIKITKDRIPMTPYIHFNSYDECKKWIREYHAPSIRSIQETHDSPSGNYGC